MQCIKPQPGPQTRFLASSADIAIYGGAAGGGKTWALLLDPLRYVDNGEFGCVIFRRNYTQIFNEGALWDESENLYQKLNAKPNKGDGYWTFPSGARISFAHLQHETNIYNWQGAQIPSIIFDELTHFTEKQFWYLLSRNRSMSGVRPHIRAATNPDADGWVRRLIDWWIDANGLAIPERSGVVRWFLRVSGELEWGDSREALIERFKHLPSEQLLPKSITFISASIYDNKKLLETNPEYLANLLNLTPVEQAQLLHGNWNARYGAGKFINREWFSIIEQAERHNCKEVRFWDFAATEATKGKDPSFSVGVKMRKVGDRFQVVDMVHFQKGAIETIEEFMRVTKQDFEEAKRDGRQYAVRWEQEPGSASKREAARLVADLHKRVSPTLDARALAPRCEKFERAKGFASAAYHRNVSVLRGAWNEAWLTHLHNQPETGKTDIMDGSSGAYNELSSVTKTLGGRGATGAVR